MNFRRLLLTKCQHEFMNEDEEEDTMSDEVEMAEDKKKVAQEGGREGQSTNVLVHDQYLLERWYVDMYTLSLFLC